MSYFDKIRRRVRDMLAAARERALSVGDFLEPSLTPTWRSRLRACRLCLFIALANLTQNRLRFVVAAGGAAVPILLLTIQIAFLGAVREKVTTLYDRLDFDVAIVSDSYQFLFSGGSFDRVRLSQAKAVPGVADSFALNIGNTRWVDAASGRYSPVMLIGLDATGGFVRDPAIRQGLAGLASGRDVLADSYSSPDLGPVTAGTEAKLAGETVQVAGQFALGMFFYADGSVIMPNTSFPRFNHSDAESVSVGLLKLDKGADPARVGAALSAALPRDVRVLSRDQLLGEEEDFFLTTKPIGIMLRISMFIAFVVGAVILLQVLSVEIVNRIHEFATLKAMGFSIAFVLGVGLCETALLAIAAFVAALAAGSVLLAAVQWSTHLETAVSASLAAGVLAIVLCMCFVSGFAVVRRIAKADPAELY